MNELTGAIPSHLMERPEVEAREPKTSMGKDDFMTLLMAQLKNQDPLNPMDHKEFSAQLAQFASLEKLTQIGSGIQKLEGGMGEEQKLQALGMIGKRVKASSAEVNLIENQPVDIQLNSEGGFKPLKVSIFSGDGKLVREIDVDPRTQAKAVNWDGKTNDGQNAMTGKYLFRVAGVGANGKSQEMQMNVTGKVIGVEMNENNPVLLVQTGSSQTKVELAKVQNINTEEAEKKETKPGEKTEGGQSIPRETTPIQDPATASAEYSNDWPRSSVVDSGQGWMEFK